MRTPIDFLLAGIERRLAVKISSGEGALVQALANRYSAKGRVNVVFDPTATVKHLEPVRFDEHGMCDDIAAFVDAKRNELQESITPRKPIDSSLCEQIESIERAMADRLAVGVGPLVRALEARWSGLSRRRT